MSDLASINTESRLYVIRAAGGYSCLGFDVAEKWARGVAAWLPASDVPAGFGAFKPGTFQHYQVYRAVMAAGARHAERTKTRCPALLESRLIGLEGKRVHVTAPDYNARFWVGKSTGWLPIHLEIESRNSSGGGGVYLPDGASIQVIR
ncbi:MULTISPECIES: hypothetical protein [Bradyrhizobium]|jgi:hypothetical protein|uniref:hypothetical protein n=1 Tax=Bradyrhizobium TaxID=374 RepID=UPI0004B11679|nr:MULTISPECIES: hypothetical protein [Bradyrhizobium]MBR1030083.1 hypothetical protein [Bradyrhizobium liaoningense]MBR1066863.1 hypothetical protein [Bradyrhizobium liaoningense]MDI2074505.1 hypothetical protein [Bradyrhizobium sp. Mp27]